MNSSPDYAAPPCTDRRGSAEACLCLHFTFGVSGKVSGPDYLIVGLMTHNYSMLSHLLDEMGAAAYRLPARWQDYARCTYAAGPSVAGLQTLAPRFHGGYVCMSVLKIKR